MARPYRLNAENCFYHITSRGDGRKNIYASEYDYRKFLEYIVKAKKRFEFYVYAYVLMPNHYHLLIKTLHANISKLMHYVNGSYTTYFNVKRKKTGHLFQGRYKSVVVDSDEYFSILSRYIHLNPVKAKLVKMPEEYKWSSYSEYMSKRKNCIVDKREITKVLGMTKEQYRQFVMEGVDKRENPFKNLYGGFLLGGEGFIKDKIKELKGQVEGEDYTHRRLLRRYVSVEDIDNVMKKERGRGIAEICASRLRPMTDKRIAIYLMKELTGLNNKQIGEEFKMNSSAVSKAAVSIKKEIEENSQMRKEMHRLFSIFEG